MATAQKRPAKHATVYSIASAADLLGLSTATVRTYCQRGVIGHLEQLPGSGMSYYVLTERDIAWLRDDSNRPKGRPPKS